MMFTTIEDINSFIDVDARNKLRDAFGVASDHYYENGCNWTESANSAIGKVLIPQDSMGSALTPSIVKDTLKVW